MSKEINFNHLAERIAEKWADNWQQRPDVKERPADELIDSIKDCALKVLNDLKLPEHNNNWNNDIYRGWNMCQDAWIKALSAEPKEEVNLVGEFNAQVWAKEFVRIVKQNPEIPTDEGAMIGWFANSIMSGYDRGIKAATPRPESEPKADYKHPMTMQEIVDAEKPSEPDVEELNPQGGYPQSSICQKINELVREVNKLKRDLK